MFRDKAAREQTVILHNNIMDLAWTKAYQQEIIEILTSRKAKARSHSEYNFLVPDKCCSCRLRFGVWVALALSLKVLLIGGNQGYIFFHRKFILVHKVKTTVDSPVLFKSCPERCKIDKPPALLIWVCDLALFWCRLIPSFRCSSPLVRDRLRIEYSLILSFWQPAKQPFFVLC